jgi:hypothetical protein
LKSGSSCCGTARPGTAGHGEAWHGRAGRGKAIFKKGAIVKWCTQCRNQANCYYWHPYIGHYCPGVETKISNNKESKEPLLSDLSSTINVDNVNARDYKDVLAEVRDQQCTEKVKAFLRILRMDTSSKREMTRKAIAAMLFFNISPVWIMRILKRRKTVFYGYVNGGRK